MSQTRGRRESVERERFGTVIESKNLNTAIVYGHNYDTKILYVSKFGLVMIGVDFYSAMLFPSLTCPLCQQMGSGR